MNSSSAGKRRPRAKEMSFLKNNPHSLTTSEYVRNKSKKASKADDPKEMSSLCHTMQMTQQVASLRKHHDDEDEVLDLDDSFRFHQSSMLVSQMINRTAINSSNTSPQRSGFQTGRKVQSGIASTDPNLYLESYKSECTPGHVAARVKRESRSRQRHKALCHIGTTPGKLPCNNHHTSDSQCSTGPPQDDSAHQQQMQSGRSSLASSRYGVGPRKLEGPVINLSNNTASKAKSATRHRARMTNLSEK